MMNAIRIAFSAARRLICLPMAALLALSSAPSQARSAHRGGADSYTCMIHVGYGEANGKGAQEAAIVLNSLMRNAARDHLSICAEAYRRYQPRSGSSPDIARAADDVLHRGGTLVPGRFRSALRFRAPGAASPHNPRLRLIGQFTRGGNVFYALK